MFQQIRFPPTQPQKKWPNWSLFLCLGSSLLPLPFWARKTWPIWLCFSCFALSLPLFHLPLKHEKCGQFSCVFCLWVLLYPLCHSKHEKHSWIGRIFCVSLCLLPLLISHSNMKNTAKLAVFFVFGLFFTPSAIPSTKNTAKLAMFFMFHFVSSPLSSPTQTRKMRSKLGRVFVFGLFFTPSAVLSTKNMTKLAVFFVFCLAVISSPSPYPPTQTQKTWPKQLFSLCLGSSPLSLTFWTQKI